MTTKDIPAAACTFQTDAIEISEADDSGNVDVKFLARSGQPIQHSYWGNVVHDMAGFKAGKSIPIDYAHGEEAIGFAIPPTPGPGDLELTGKLTPFKEGDRASEVIHKSAQGVPYQASINFAGEGIKIQELAEGQSAPVNGYEFSGPGVIIREFPLRGVAVCLYGADSNTSTSLNEGETIPVLYEEPVEMAETKEQIEAAKLEAEKLEAAKLEAETVEAAKLEAEKLEAAKLAATVGVTDERETCKKFVAEFGDIGGRWFAEGLSFDDARSKQVEILKSENIDLTKKLAHVNETELAATASGEYTPETAEPEKSFTAGWKKIQKKCAEHFAAGSPN